MEKISIPLTNPPVTQPGLISPAVGADERCGAEIVAEFEDAGEEGPAELGEGDKALGAEGEEKLRLVFLRPGKGAKIKIGK